MERLKQRLAIANNVLTLLNDALQMPDTTIVRDAAIQRFQFTFEAVWKLVQRYLFMQEGLEVNAPKSVFRACFQVGLLSASDTAICLQMTDDRNLAVHAYNEAVSEILFKQLYLYYTLLKLLVQTIGKNVSS